MENGYYGSKAFENYCRTWSEQETNVLIGDVSEKDRELFLGPTFGFETFHEADDKFKYPQLLGKFGFFKSNGDARRNGWDKDIPEGYSEHSIGKLKKKLYILKNTTGW